LVGMGYEVQAKPARDFKDRKQSWSMGMVFDILSMRDKIDMAIALTHEEDFVDALPYLRSMGIPVEVWGFPKILPSSLKQESARFQFIPPQVVDKKGTHVRDSDVGEPDEF
ncbi:MAG: NYN domain-containing protein, partial [Dehalococcoidia bacterium]|nr:NYN domain-containing protein [Dehalococcoidia bacterium]